MSTVAATGMNVAEAGRRGADVRSDCWVRIELAESGDVALQLRSKVASMYGDAIRRQVRNVLADLGVMHARVELEDGGALPWVIAARIEAAVRRVRPSAPAPQHLPHWGRNTRYATARERRRRSRLYLPGNEPKFMLNAGLHRPDAVILDLEDSVAPAAKDEARLLVRNALRSVDFHRAERMVRINPGERGLEDLAFVVPHNVHVILIPKVESGEQVRAVERRVRELSEGRSVPRPPASPDAGSADECAAPLLMPIIETARGVLNAAEIASACDSVVALTIGLEDYTADIGATRTAEGRESLWARCAVVNAARAAGIPPIDSVFSDVDDEAGLRASVLEARSLGFEGKGCIHPRQIRIIHEAFAPTPQELDKARRIVAAFEEAQAQGLGVVALGGKMIDPPVLKRAMRIVREAQRGGTDE